jgi:hypothetical protein
MGWLSYLQAQSHTNRRIGGMCAFAALIFAAIALSDPGVPLSLGTGVVGGIGLLAVRWRTRNRLGLWRTKRSDSKAIDSSERPISTE